jgi:hypothetical protein
MKHINEMYGRSAKPFNIRTVGTYGSLNAIVAQPTNCPIGVNKYYDWAQKYNYIQQ